VTLMSLPQRGQGGDGAIGTHREYRQGQVPKTSVSQHFCTLKQHTGYSTGPEMKPIQKE